MDEPVPCTVCGVLVAIPELHRQWHEDTRDDDEGRRNGALIDAFLAEVDAAAIDKDILDGTVDEPYNAAAVIDRLRGLLRSG
jgi:hypothetical protein